MMDLIPELLRKQSWMQLFFATELPDDVRKDISDYARARAGRGAVTVLHRFKCERNLGRQPFFGEKVKRLSDVVGHTTDPATVVG